MDFFLSTIALPLATLLTLAAKIISDWWHLKRARAALQENTDLTRKSMQNSADAKAEAAETAKVVAEKTDLAVEIVNGRMEQLIRTAYEKGLAEGKLKKDAP